MIFVELYIYLIFLNPLDMIEIYIYIAHVYTPQTYWTCFLLASSCAHIRYILVIFLEVRTYNYILDFTEIFSNITAFES